MLSKILSSIAIVFLPLIFTITIYYIHRIGKKHNASNKLLKTLENCVILMAIITMVCFGISVFILIERGI